MEVLEKEFNAYVLIKGKDDGGSTETPDGKKYLHGPAALVEEDGLGSDFDKDDLAKAAVVSGLKTFERLGGQVDWDHLYQKSHNPSHIVGKCVGIQDNPTGGAPIVTTELFMSKPFAKGAWEHHEAGGVLGYSLQGVAKARDPKNHKRITDLDIHMLTITPMPKGFEGPRLSGGAASLGDVVKGLNAELAGGAEDGWEHVEYPEDAADVALSADAVSKGIHVFCSKCGDRLDGGLCKTCGQDEAGEKAERVTKAVSKHKYVSRSEKPGGGWEYQYHVPKGHQVYDARFLKRSGSRAVDMVHHIVAPSKEDAITAQRAFADNANAKTSGMGNLRPVDVSSHGEPGAVLNDYRKSYVGAGDWVKRNGPVKCTAKLIHPDGSSEASPFDYDKQAFDEHFHHENEAPVKKALTTDSGMVGTGVQGGSALRKQDLTGATTAKTPNPNGEKPSERRKKRKKKRTDRPGSRVPIAMESVSKALVLELSRHGVTNAGAMARVIARS